MGVVASGLLVHAFYLANHVYRAQGKCSISKSFWELASNKSLWCGYDYFRLEKAVSFIKVTDEVYECCIEGFAVEFYHTVINTGHPRDSHSDCPFDEGRRVICKHMVALCFTVFSSEVYELMRVVEESGREEKRRLQEHYFELKRYVKSLKKEDLQCGLYNALIELEERKDRY